jgi:hypothetical protein
VTDGYFFLIHDICGLKGADLVRYKKVLSNNEIICKDFCGNVHVTFYKSIV